MSSRQPQGFIAKNKLRVMTTTGEGFNP